MRLENKIIMLVNGLITLPYNIGIIILTSVIWMVTFMLPYYNNNFDLISTISNNIVFFTAGSAIASLIMSNREGAKQIGSLAIISFLLSIIALPIVKSVPLATFGMMMLYPISIFCFLILIKNIWLVISKNS